MEGIGIRREIFRFKYKELAITNGHRTRAKLQPDYLLIATFSKKFSSGF
jgi:hypothetical protein